MCGEEQKISQSKSFLEEMDRTDTADDLIINITSSSQIWGFYRLIEKESFGKNKVSGETMAKPRAGGVSSKTPRSHQSAPSARDSLGKQVWAVAVDSLMVVVPKCCSGRTLLRVCSEKLRNKTKNKSWRAGSLCSDKTSSEFWNHLTQQCLCRCINLVTKHAFV